MHFLGISGPSFGLIFTVLDRPQPLTQSLPVYSGMGERLGSAKERKLMDWDMDGLISERKGQ